jgi:hypothetical protein
VERRKEKWPELNRSGRQKAGTWQREICSHGMCTRLNPAKSGLSVASDDMMPSCCVTRAVASDACDFVRCGGVHRHHVACASGVNWRVTACSGVFYIALLISQYEPWPTSLPSPWMTQDRHCCAPSSPSHRSTSLVSGTCVISRRGGQFSGAPGPPSAKLGETQRAGVRSALTSTLEVDLPVVLVLGVTCLHKVEPRRRTCCMQR